MELTISRSVLRGRVKIPPSKSHSIRAVFLASLSDAVSTVKGRLKSTDVDSAINACRALGAVIDEDGDILTVGGTGGGGGGGGVIKPVSDVIDVGNSGTTARFVLSMAALSDKPITVTGDAQTRKRPMMPLCDSLSQLGATIEKISAGGFLPIRIKGILKGGSAEVDGKTSQYLSSLLIHSPFCKTGTTLRLESLNEKPYVDMTLAWLQKLGIKVTRSGYTEYRIPPKQQIKSFVTTVPADFSSAAFFLALSAIEGSDVELSGLDMNDTQGDKRIIDFLKEMGADIECDETIRIKGRMLKGKTLDLNGTPDGVPAMAVVGCLAQGTTRIVNVPQARIKETDRIAVMAAELKKMGADIEEKNDGLVIRRSRLKGAKLNGHNDHRVVMSLAVAGLAAEGRTQVSTAESVDVTFPDFVDLMQSCGADMEMNRNRG